MQNIAYIGAFVFRPGRVLQLWKSLTGEPLLPNVYAHHCTLVHDPSGLGEAPHEIGSVHDLNVVGYVSTPDVQAFVVRGVESENEFPHITVAVSDDTPPSDSKGAIHGNKIQRFDSEPGIKTKVGFSTGCQPHFSTGNELAATRQITGEEAREIHVFDFDGTLFKSPTPPDDFDGHPSKWWVTSRSLSEPQVPGSPGEEWFFEDALKQARRSVENDDVFTVLVTGRTATHDGLRFRVRDLLRQQGLHFDRFLFSTMQQTSHYKRRALCFLVELLSPTRVRIWENNHVNLCMMKRAAARKDIPFEGNLVPDERIGT